MLKRSGLVRSTTFGAVAVTAALTLTACGGSSSGGSSTGSTGGSSTAPTASPTPIAAIPSLTGDSTSVKLDAGFLKALTTLKLTPGTVGKATLTDGSLHFPITSGDVKYYTPNGPVEPYVQGTIHHEGSGLSLTSGKTKVELTNFVVDPGASILTGKVTVNGTVAYPSAPLFDLDGTTLQPLKTDTPKTGQAELTGTTVKVTSTAAAALDKVFGTTAVKGGLVVGIATIIVDVPSS